MNVANIYRKLKQILDDSNTALINKGLSSVKTLNEIPMEIKKISSINRLPYLLNSEISIITKDDLASLSNIATYALYRNSNITSITIPDSVISIGSNAFWDCDNLKSVNIGNGVITINSDSFNGCNNLTNITIGNNVSAIGSGAFGNCNNLTSIILPGSITSMGKGIFYGCDNLLRIDLYSTVPPAFDAAYSSIPTTTTIHVPVGCGDAYKEATGWSYFADQIVADIEIV